MIEEPIKMGSTLQEQFLKMGLVDNKQVKKAKKAQHLHKTLNVNKDNEIKAGAQQALKEKKARSRLLNQTRNEGTNKQETASRIRQLIEANRIAVQGGETPYNFTDNNTIKRLYLKKEIVEQLGNGDLAIVKQAGDYQIIPSEVAEKIREYNKNLIVVHHSQIQDTTRAEKDPYAEYKVPDDLIW